MKPDERVRPIHVLLIEDDEDDQVLVRDALRDIGPERMVLDWRQDIDQAIEALCEGRHDVCLLDHRLGARTGLEVLKQARARGCRVPIILLTGVADAQVDREALEAGASDLLLKSQISPVVLERAIHSTLQQARIAEALRRSQASFHELIERLPDGISVWHEDRLIYVNAATVALLGASSADELVGRTGPEMEAFIHPDDREMLRPVEREGLQGARSVREIRLLRGPGEIVPAELSRFNVVFDGRQCSMWITRNLTERRQLQAQLMLSDRMASLGTLAAGLSHEINNPLGYVVSNLSHLEAELLSSQPLDEGRREELRALLAETQHGVQRIRDITHQLRLFSQAEREAHTTHVEVRRAMETAVRLAWNEIRHRALLIRDYADPIMVEAQEARLVQVFLNLLVNAAHAIPEGSVGQHEIHVVSRRQDRLAIIEFRDTGVSIPPELQSRAFEPFAPLHPDGGTTGLGLSVCLGIVTGFNGRMEVESQRGQGNIFRVILPAVAPEPVATAPAAASPAPATQRRGRVLSVDDEPMIGTAITRALRQESDVTTLTSGREALAQLIRGERYDLILCDLMMPEMSGMELFEEIQRLVPEQAERVVFLTGGAFTPMAREFLGRVKNRCVEKPFTAGQLRELVRSRLGEISSSPARP